MRLGGSIFVDDLTPERWIEALKAEGYGAAYCPVTSETDEATLDA